MSTLAEQVEEVKAYALAHYEDGGWDVIVEAWDDDQIADTITSFGATTRKQAVKAVGEVVDVYADRQADAKNSAF